MEAIKKHKIMVVGLVVAVALGVLGLIAVASNGIIVEEAAITADQEVKSCPANCTKACCKAKNEVKACPANCTKPCCAAKNAEEK